MKNLLVMAVAALFATSASAAEMKWNGGADWRYSSASVNDQLNSLNNTTANQDISTTKYLAHEIRANLDVTGGWEHVEYGVGFRTQSSANNEFSTVKAGGSIGLNFDQAWFRYTRDFGGLDFALTVGRQMNANVYDKQWETLFSNYDRWDGFGWNFKSGMFGLNAAQYILGAQVNNAPAGTNNASSQTYTAASQATATSSQNFSVLYSVNPYMNFKFADEIELLFSVAWYKWTLNGTAAENQIGGGMTGITMGNASGNGGTVPELANGNFLMSNGSQWDFLANLSLPYSLAFTGDFVMANKAYYNNLSVVTSGGASDYNGSVNGQTQVSSTAWTLGLTYGKLRKAQDFTIGYAYTTKGIGSVLDTFTNDKFAADNKGHTIVAGYNIADNLHINFRWLMLQEKQRIAATGAAATDGLAYGGVNANQQNKTSYWEISGGAAF
jgi:hypothetical protein